MMTFVIGLVIGGLLVALIFGAMQTEREQNAYMDGFIEGQKASNDFSCRCRMGALLGEEKR